MEKRVIAYIDGFNLYHALKDLKDERLKWVNLHSLMESIIRGGEKLIQVNYFSAYATWKSEEYARHRVYVSFLKHFGVQAIMGKFKGRKVVTCNECGKQWEHHEEKETDVNLALQILRDGFEDAFDRAIIVTADSDLAPVLKQGKLLFPNKEFFIATPPGRHNNAHEVRSLASSNMNISKGRIKANLLPVQIIQKDGKILSMPPKYKEKYF